MLDLLLLGFAIVLWACYCCRRRHGIQGLRRVPILGSEPTNKMTEEERLALVEKQLVTVTIGGSVQSLRNLITSAHSMYEANCCNCDNGDSTNGNAKDEKDCEQNENFNESASERTCLSRTWSAACTTIAQHRQDECIICFEEYKDGDEICWAKTDQCQHVFHKKCAVEWLKNHDECPLCRIDIIHAKTVTYEEADDEMDIADLELGGDGDAHSDDVENGTEEDADIARSAETSPVTQEQENPCNSSHIEEIASQARSEGYSTSEENQDLEMATTPPPDGIGSVASETVEVTLEQQGVQTKLVDFTGSIHSIKGG